MNEIWKRLIDWAIQKKRWPLLLPPILVPFGFGFLQVYCQLSFRDTVGDWRFLTFSGAVGLISGILCWLAGRVNMRFERFDLRLLLSLSYIGLFIAILYRALYRERRITLWWSLAMAFAGCVFVATGILRIPPPPPPCVKSLPADKLVVTIASFTPSAGAESQASYITGQLEDALSRMQGAGAPIEPYRSAEPPVPNTGNNDDKNKAAISLGEPPNRCAHAVLWGKVLKDNQNKLDVTAKLTIVNGWQKRDAIETTIAYYSPNLIFHEKASDREIASSIADIAALVFAVAHYRVEEWDEAIRILEPIKSKEALLYKGLCYYRKAQNSANTEYLNTAIETYKTVLDDPNMGAQLEAEEKNELTAIAHSLLADAYLTKGVSSTGEGAVTSLKAAEQNYDDALEASLNLYNLWAVETNLGVAEYELARRVSDNQVAHYLQRSEEAYRSALKDCTGQERNSALVHSDLGSTLAFWSTRAEGQEKKDHLEDAEKELKSARNFFLQERPSKQWAMVETDYASVLLEMGKQISMGPGDTDDLSKAVESYEAVLKVYDRQKEPRKHATVQSNLGTALYEMWKRNQIERDLQAALVAFRTAVEIREEIGSSPVELANSKYGLAKTLTEIGSRPEGERQAESLDEAIRIFNTLLLFYNQVAYPQKHQQILDERATAVNAQQRLSTTPRR